MVHSRMTKEEIQAEIYRLELILAECQFQYNAFIMGATLSIPMSELDNITFVTQMQVNDCRKMLLLR
jgi:hypothetical protein